MPNMRYPGDSACEPLTKTSCISVWKVSTPWVTVKCATRSSSEVARGKRLWTALTEVAIAKRSNSGS